MPRPSWHNHNLPPAPPSLPRCHTAGVCQTVKRLPLSHWQSRTLCDGASHSLPVPGLWRQRLTETVAGQLSRRHGPGLPVTVTARVNLPLQQCNLVNLNGIITGIMMIIVIMSRSLQWKYTEYRTTLYHH